MLGRVSCGRLTMNLAGDMCMRSPVCSGQGMMYRSVVSARFRVVLTLVSTPSP